LKRFLIDDKSFATRISTLADISSQENLEETFARAALSMLTEPGDSFAGFMTQHLGSAKLLEFEIARVDTDVFKSALAQVDALEDAIVKFGDFDVSHGEARERWSSRLNLAALSAALDIALAVGAKILTPASNHWPALLNDLEFSTPHCMWVRSQNLSAIEELPALAVVGSRVSSAYGEWVTSEIVSDATARGMSIVSGGAYGIDSIAHRAALAQNQFTVAFMAGGIDRLYPSGNEEMLQAIGRQGALIAEQAPGASPTKWRFLQRNRLIAALGRATVVVEAGIRSGALNTVTHAQSLQRPIGAVPGAITSQASAGCNQLLRAGGAEMICSVSDAADLALGKQGWFQPQLGGLGGFETRALDAMNSRPQSDLAIASRAGLTHKEIAIALGQLSLLGFVEQTDRGWVKLPLEREQRTKASGK
jgi:DNA processing protein